MANRSVLQVDKTKPDYKETMGATLKMQLTSTYEVAICTHLIVAHIKNTFRSNLSIYEIIQILRISAMDKTPIIMSENCDDLDPLKLPNF